jgi:hypothetical protein
MGQSGKQPTREQNQKLNLKFRRKYNPKVISIDVDDRCYS